MKDDKSKLCGNSILPRCTFDGQPFGPPLSMAVKMISGLFFYQPVIATQACSYSEYR